MLGRAAVPLLCPVVFRICIKSIMAQRSPLLLSILIHLLRALGTCNQRVLADGAPGSRLSRGLGGGLSHGEEGHSSSFMKRGHHNLKTWGQRASLKYPVCFQWTVMMQRSKPDLCANANCCAS